MLTRDLTLYKTRAILIYALCMQCFVWPLRPDVLQAQWPQWLVVLWVAYSLLKIEFITHKWSGSLLCWWHCEIESYSFCKNASVYCIWRVCLVLLVQGTIE